MSFCLTYSWEKSYTEKKVTDQNVVYFYKYCLGKEMYIEQLFKCSLYLLEVYVN